MPDQQLNLAYKNDWIDWEGSQKMLTRVLLVDC